jgi:hypothetical protein
VQTFIRDENTFTIFGNRALRRISCIICTPYKIISLSISRNDDKVNGECSMPNEYEQCIQSFCQTTRRNDVTSDIWMYIRR